MAGQGKRALFVIGMLSLLLTGFLWLRELNLEERRAKDVFRSQAGLIVNEIEAQVGRYEHLLRSSGAGQSVEQHTNPESWRSYVASLDIERDYPAIAGFGLVMLVKEADKDAFLRKARELRPDFKIFPSRAYPEHYVNYVLEPSGAYRAVGFDVASREDRKEAADRARESGEIAISGKTSLIIPGATTADVLLYLPLYQTSMPPDTPEQRQKALWGWMVAGMSIPKLMANILDRTGALADIAIYDNAVKSPETLLFTTKPLEAADGGTHLRFTTQRQFAGRPWLIEFTSRREFEESVETGRAFVILSGGVAATILMALTAWILLSAKARAETRAESRLTELERERDYATAVLTASPAAILTLDEQGAITKANRMGGVLTGRLSSDLVGMAFPQVFVPVEDRSVFLRQMLALKAGGDPLVVEMGLPQGETGRILNWTIQAVRDAVRNVRYFVAAGVDVTQRWQAEESLKAERALFLSGPVVVFRWKAEAGWPVEYVSPNVIQFGCIPEALMSGKLPFVDLIHPDDLGPVATEVAKLTAQGANSFEQKYRLVRPNDGDVRWVEDRTLIERDARGRVLSYLGYLVDVTDREKSLESKRDSEKRIARVLATSSEGYWELDSEWRTIAVNPALLAMLEVDEASIMGRTPQEFMAPGWEERMRAVVDERNSREHRSFDMAYRAASGRVVHARVNATSLFDRKGKLIGSFGLITDVTAEKIAEEALLSEQGRLRLIVDSLPLALVISRLDEALVLNANNAACQLFGLGGRDMEGRSPFEFYVDPGDRNRFAALLHERGTVIDFEALMKRLDGSTFWGLLSARLVSFEGSDCALIGCVDITARKQADAKLASMADELSRSNAELEQFAYVASHDLQEPLRMIASYVQLLERRYGGKLDKDAHEYIDFAVDGAKRMQALITDLLEFSRVSRKGTPLIPVELDRIVAEALVNLSAAVEESQAVVDVASMPTVRGDAAQLVRLFQNLIGNAIKYRKPDTAPAIRVSASKKSSGYWEISIQDNGIGINEAYFERIFIIFQRLHTRADYPGTGIGLALCKKIVERHGGQIGLRSIEGEGSTFIFTLPGLTH